MSRFLSPKVIETLYLYYVRPMLEYASPLWAAAITQEDSLMLERLQASVARSILRADWRTPKTTLFKTLDWPSLKFRREVQCVKLFRHLVCLKSDLLVSCLPEVFRKSPEGYNFRKSHVIPLPYAKSKQMSKSFFLHAVVLWNSLPKSVASAPSTSAFDHALMAHWSTHKHDLNPDLPNVLPL